MSFKKYFWLVLILVIGTTLRFYHNTDISLWHDEAFSALLIKYSWPEMMYRIGLDVHPPMYYIFLRLWHYAFGDSLLALRGMTVFFGVGTIWATWAFVRQSFPSTGSGQVKSDKIALWAALLVAFNPFQIQYATEARMYTMGAFFAMLAAYFVTKALHAQKQYYSDERYNMPNLPQDITLRKKMFWNYVGFTLSIIVLIYTHYYLLFTAAAICFYAFVYLLCHHEGKFVRKFIPLLLSLLVIVISYVPWLKTFFYQYNQVGAGYWIPKMDIWSIPSTLWQLTLGFGHDVNNLTTQRWLVFVTIVMLYVLFRFLRKIQQFEKWLVVLAILAPFAGSILFLILAKLKGSDSSVYLVRYFIFTSAFLTIVIAACLATFKWRIVGWFLLLAYSLTNLLAFSSYWKDVNIAEKPGMNSAAEMVAANAEPSHKVFVGTSFEFFNYKYYRNVYYPTPQRPLLFTGGTRHTKDISHFAGSAILTDEDLVPDFAEATKPGDVVWLLWTNAFGSSKPNVPQNWQQIDEKSYAEVRPYLGTWIIVTQYKVN
jgi:mannosyltransferase